VSTRRAPDPNAPQTDERLITRRHAVGIGMGVGFVAVAAGAVTFAFASAGSGDTLTVWQLAADWDEPRGPHRKTRLVSGASRKAAYYRYARSSSDAENLNLHQGSWAPPIEVEVDRSYFNDLWSTYATEWHNPWNAETIELIDLRFGTADRDEADRRHERLLTLPSAQETTTEPPSTTAAAPTTTAPATTTTALAATTTLLPSTTVPTTTTTAPAASTTTAPVSTTTAPVSTTTTAPATTTAPTTTTPPTTTSSPAQSVGATTTTSVAPATTTTSTTQPGTTTTSTTRLSAPTTTTSTTTTSTTSTSTTTIAASPTSTTTSVAPPATTTTLSSGGPLVVTTTTSLPITSVEAASEQRWPRVLSSSLDKFAKGAPGSSFGADPAVAAGRVGSTGSGSSSVMKWSLPLGVSAAAAALGAVLLRRRQLTAHAMAVPSDDPEPPIT
jgi:hypothetical protein